MGEEFESSTLLKLVSVPGLVALIVLSVALTWLSRPFGTENVLREVLTELVASIGSTILVLATFGLLFRTGLERLLPGLRRAERPSRNRQSFSRTSCKT